MLVERLGVVVLLALFDELGDLFHPVRIADAVPDGRGHHHDFHGRDAATLLLLHQALRNDGLKGLG